jgi:hypothetical protein
MLCTPLQVLFVKQGLTDWNTHKKGREFYPRPFECLSYKLASAKFSCELYPIYACADEQHFLIMALRMPNTLRIHAVSATFGFFPASTRRR